jgi:hypothetical protein
MSRRLILALFASLALTLTALGAPASAAPTTTTIHEKGLVETFPDVVPSCEPGGETYIVTTTSNLIMHETVFDDGRVHATFTQAGKVSAVPADGTGPTYTGRFAVWGGFNANGSTVNGTFTFNVTLWGSDGSRVSNHQVDHFNVRPDGTVNEFFHCH